MSNEAAEIPMTTANCGKWNDESSCTTKPDRLLGVSTLVFEDEPLTCEHLRQIKAMGLEAVELIGLEGHFDCEDSAQVQALRQCAKDLGLHLCSLHSSLTLLDGRFGEQTLEKMKTEIEVLAELGGELLVIHPCELANPGDPFAPEGSKLRTHLSWVRDVQRGGEAAMLIVRRLAALARHADDQGVRLAVENCDMHSLEFALAIARSQMEIDFVREQHEIHTLDFVRKWMALLEQDELEQVGICFDTGHANLLDAPGMLRVMGQRVLTTHIHDNHGSGDEHLLPFGGNIDWEELTGVFSEIGYRGRFVYEVGVAPAGRHLADRDSRIQAVTSTLPRFRALLRDAHLGSGR